VRERDTGIVTCIFFSVVLLFLSGAVWPACNMPRFWRIFSYLFPSTHGIQGYIRINTMGATLQQVKFEYLMLWLQTALYFATSCLCLRAAKKLRIG
jgi:ABC-2 type transport system permease protein